MTNDHSVPTQVCAFELDDVLYAKRDYLLQVYYLFANFVEFSEGKPLASALLTFMKTTYEQEGEDSVWEKTQAAFTLKTEYKENLDRILVNAQLPLRLELHEHMRQALTTALAQGQSICILTAGNPVMQLNKLKHLDLGVFERLLKVFFVDELKFRGFDPISYLSTDYNVEPANIKWIRD